MTITRPSWVWGSTAALALVVFGISRYLRTSLGPVSAFTGWVLFTLIVFLMLFQLRKRLSFLPLGSASDWLQLHIAAGVLSGLVFVWHLKLEFPNGLFEIVLAALFGTAFLSGVFGAIVSRVTPIRLARHGETLVFESIPKFNRELRLRAESLVLESVGQAQSTTLAEFYQRKLADYFAKTHHKWSHIRGSLRVRFQLEQAFAHIEPFLDEQEREILADLKDLTWTKLNLDYQYAGLWLLRGWLFFHIPLSYSLLAFVVFHILFVYTFHAGGL